MSDIEFEQMGEVVPDSETPFLINGLVHRTATMVYGRPKAGKSFVALSLAMALSEGTPWLGREVEQKRTLLWVLDPGQRDETWQRWHAAGGKPDSQLLITASRPEDDDDWWNEFTGRLVGANVDVLVVDNLSALLGRGSYNNDSDVRPALGRLQALLDEGIAVVVVHHSGKFNEEQGSQQSPMGSTAIEAWGRQFVQVSADAELRILRCYGNNTPETEIGIALNPYGEGAHGAFVTLVGEEQTGAMTAEHDDLVAKATARWEQRRANKAHKGTTAKGSRSKARGVPERVTEALQGRPDGLCWSDLREAVGGANKPVSEAANAMVTAGTVRKWQDGRKTMYALVNADQG